jgi:hypothetical protein
MKIIYSSEASMLILALGSRNGGVMATKYEVLPTDTPLQVHDDPKWHLDATVLAIFVFGVAFLFGTNREIFRDGDTSWHIAAGQWMIDHREIPYSDPFSYTAFGKPWVAHEWLSEVLMALVHGALGFTGLATFVALAVAATFLILAMRLQRWSPPVEMCLQLMVVAVALNPLIAARPLVLTWPLLAFWTEALLRAREEQRLPTLLLIPLTTLWINLHASFAVGLGLLAIFGLDAVCNAEDRLRALRQWFLFGSACGVAVLINPHGLAGAIFPLGVFTSPTVGLVDEFKSTRVDLFPAFEIALLLFIAVSLWRGARLRLLPLFIFLAFLHLALAHIRHQALFLIVGTLVALPATTRAWIDNAPAKRPIFAVLQRRLGTVKASAGVLLAVVVATLIIRFLAPSAPPESEVNANTAFAWIPAELRRERVLNEYSMGGPLILRGIKVFMDGRTDVYGDAHFLNYRDVANGNAVRFSEAERKWGFCWTIFPPSSDALIKVLDHSAGWKRAYSDKYAIIHVRPPCGPYR